MFAIYDIQGRRFRDTLERLYKVREAQPGHGPLWTREHAQPPYPPGAGATHRGGAESPVSRAAQQAYREMLQRHEREPIHHAYQLMSHPVVTIRADLGVAAAKDRFRKQRFHQFPVLNAQLRIVGMLSERDLLRFLLLQDDPAHTVRGQDVAHAMSRAVITADPISDVRRIARVMLEFHLGAMPIVDEADALVGLVSRSDILHAVVSDPPLNLWS
jgi:CBS domain-containing protein